MIRVMARPGRVPSRRRASLSASDSVGLSDSESESESDSDPVSVSSRVRLTDTFLTIAKLKNGTISSFIFSINKIIYLNNFCLFIEYKDLSESKLEGTILKITTKYECSLGRSIWRFL